MYHFVGPGADARRDYPVDQSLIACGLLLDELQRPMHAAGFIAMHASRHQRAGKRVTPAAALDREQGVFVRIIVEVTVLDHVVARTEGVNHTQHVRLVTALDGLPCKPGSHFRLSPRKPRRADWIGCMIRHQVARSAVDKGRCLLTGSRQGIIASSCATVSCRPSRASRCWQRRWDSGCTAAYRR